MVVGLCLLVLGWTAEIVGCFVTEPNWVSDEQRNLTMYQSLRVASRPDRVPLHWPYSVSMRWILPSTPVWMSHVTKGMIS